MPRDYFHEVLKSFALAAEGKASYPSRPKESMFYPAYNRAVLYECTRRAAATLPLGEKDPIFADYLHWYGIVDKDGNLRGDRRITNGVPIQSSEVESYIAATAVARSVQHYVIESTLSRVPLSTLYAVDLDGTRQFLHNHHATGHSPDEDREPWQAIQAYDTDFIGERPLLLESEALAVYDVGEGELPRSIPDPNGAVAPIREGVGEKSRTRLK